MPVSDFSLVLNQLRQVTHNFRAAEITGLPFAALESIYCYYLMLPSTKRDAQINHALEISMATELPADIIPVPELTVRRARVIAFAQALLPQPPDVAPP